MSQYLRTPDQRAKDFAGSVAFEKEVADQFPGSMLLHEAAKEPDVWVPNGEAWFGIDVKEKNQPLTDRWHLLPGVPEEELFVFDELSIRNATRSAWPVWFVIRSRPTGQIYLASPEDVYCSPSRVSVTRVHAEGYPKGKWIVDLRHFRRVPSVGLLPAAIAAEATVARYAKAEPLHPNGIFV